MDVQEIAKYIERPEEEDPRRRQILEAAGRLFHRYGFRRTSLDDIARECRISKKTIYQHFEGKDELVRAVLFGLVYEKMDSVLWVFGNLIPEGYKGLLPNLKLDPQAKPATFREMLKAVTEFAQRMRQRVSMQMLTDLRTDYPELWRGLLEMRKPFIKGVVEMIERGQQNGDVRREINPLVATELMFTAYESLSNSPVLNAQGIGPSEIGLTFLEILSHGLLTEPPPEDKTH
ncbi:TetR/AcrR family transcriptional regulator [bacterium]|nr:TetR/AcrR family transcriptional regulator [bacterium]